jgi:hypothetical protein
VDISKQMILVRSAAGILILDNSNLNSIAALNEIEKSIREIRNGNVASIAQYPFLKTVAEANLPDNFIQSMKGSSVSEQIIMRTVGVCGLIRRLQFSLEETYHIITTHDLSDLLRYETHINSMINFVRVVSEGMTKDGLTIQDSIAYIFKPDSNRHVPMITERDVDLILSPQAKFELYLYAKAGLVLHADMLQQDRPDYKALSENARFHVAHQDKIYWNTDKGLGNLGFTIAEINEILTAHDNLTAIMDLEQQVSAMILVTKKIEKMMKSVNRIPYERAKTFTLNDKSATFSISEKNFNKLLSPSFNSRFEIGILNLFPSATPEYTPIYGLGQTVSMRQLSTSSSMPEVPSSAVQNARLLPGAGNNPTLLIGLTATSIFFLSLICYCKPRLLVNTVSLLSHASSKVLGCFKHPKKTDARENQTNEMTPQKMLYHP